MEQGILAAGEAVDGSAGGTFTLAPRAVDERPARGPLHQPRRRQALLRRLPRRRRRGRRHLLRRPGHVQLHDRQVRAGLPPRPDARARGRAARRLPGRHVAATTARSRRARPGPTLGGSVTLTADRPPARSAIDARRPSRRCGAGSVSIGTRRPPTARSRPRRRSRAPTGGALPVDLQRPADPAGRRPDLHPVPGDGRWRARRHRHGLRRGPRPESAAVGLADGRRRRTGTPTATRRYAEISGKARVGETLTALGLDWVGLLRRQARRLRADVQVDRATASTIKGATAATYRLTAKDKGKRIQVREYPRATGFATSDFARSDATRKVRIGKLAVAAPEDRRQGQGRQARGGADDRAGPAARSSATSGSPARRRSAGPRARSCGSPGR